VDHAVADEQHVALLREGVARWNAWREDTSPWPESRFVSRGGVTPDLSDASLDGLDLTGADLYGAWLSGASLRQTTLDHADLRRADLFAAHLVEASLNEALLRRADLYEASLFGADLRDADLRQADLQNANLHGAKLMGAQLEGANLTGTDLSGADLTGADLTNAILVETDLTGATIADCRVYGVSTWQLELEGATQRNLIITPVGFPDLTVDRLEVAQFVYLLLANPKLRDVIDTLTTKIVLILGRFTPERMVVLEAIRDALREHGYVPVLFNFEGPENQNVLETVQTIARLARFIVADLTDTKAVDQELQAIVPQIRVAIRPILHIEGQELGQTLRSLWAEYPDRLQKIYRYTDLDDLLASFMESVIVPSEAQAQALKQRELIDIFEP
jgi:uncharacterized protein YjbI with pentapeptide repeats